MRVSSIAPSRMRPTTTAHSSRSARNLGKMRPFEGSSSRCPERPTRWSPAATDFGDSTWMTRSTAPMSIPSSRDEVATRHGIEPRFEQLLDLEPLLARERAVVGSRHLAFSELVQPQRKPFREPAAVHEHDRRAMRLDQLQQARIDRRPDRAADAPVDRLGVAGLAHVLERHDDLEIELLGRARVDELDVAPARDEPADLLQRTLRRREPDPLERPVDEPREPFERERQVRAALRPRDRVHLVEDHRVDRREHRLRLRGEDEVERLGRRDEDVRRVALHPRPLGLRRVPVRTATESFEPMPASGPRRLRSTS